jgi:hypothetical protein
MSPTDCLALRERFSDYLDSEMSTPDARRLEEHVASCPPCREALDALRRTIEEVRAHGRLEPPAPLGEALRRALREETPACAQAVRRVPAGPIALAASLVLAAGLGLAWWIQQGRRTDESPVAAAPYAPPAAGEERAPEVDARSWKQAPGSPTADDVRERAFGYLDAAPPSDVVEARSKDKDAADPAARDTPESLLGKRAAGRARDRLALEKEREQEEVIPPPPMDAAAASEAQVLYVLVDGIDTADRERLEALLVDGREAAGRLGLEEEKRSEAALEGHDAMKRLSSSQAFLSAGRRISLYDRSLSASSEAELLERLERALPGRVRTATELAELLSASPALPAAAGPHSPPAEKAASGESEALQRARRVGSADFFIGPSSGEPARRVVVVYRHPPGDRK